MTRFYSATAQPTTLSAPCTNSATSIQVTATTGFPAVEFILALDYGTAQQELVRVTGVAGTTLTVVRGFDSTTAQAHSLGAAVRHVHSADDFRLSRTHEGLTSGVHGAAGALVGTTDAQALSNKDLSSGTNTFPASLATDAEVTSAVSTHAALTATHGVAGAIVGTTDAQALTNKTLGATNTLNGFTASRFMEADGTGKIVSGSKAIPSGVVVGTTDAQTLTNKTLTAPVIDTLSGVTGLGQLRHLKRTANQSVGSTTLVNDDTLTFPVAANAVYQMTVYTLWSTAQASGSGGLDIGMAIPAGATVSGFCEEQGGNVVNGSSGARFTIKTQGTGGMLGHHVPLLITTAGTSGSATVQWAYFTSSAVLTTISAGTWATIIRVA